MAQIDDLNLIGVAEPLNGTGNEGIGEPDVLNRPIKNLVALMERGDFDMFAPKSAIATLVDNNEFAVDVQSFDLVMLDVFTGKYAKATPNPEYILGFADLDKVLIQTGGVVTFPTATLTKGLKYYVSNSTPGAIVDMNSFDRSSLMVGFAVATNKLYINFKWWGDYADIEDNAVIMAIVMDT